MESETPRLRALLEELHGELTRESSQDVGEPRRAQLLELQGDVERLLGEANHEGRSGSAGKDTSGVEHGRLRGRLQELVASFEGAHPQLASLIEQTMNALSNMGL